MNSFRMFTIYAILACIFMSCFILNGSNNGVEAGYKKKLLKTAMATYYLLQGGTRIVLPLPIPLPIPILKQTQAIYKPQPAYYQPPTYYEAPPSYYQPAYQPPAYQYQAKYY